jgi:hypothetical protein
VQAKGSVRRIVSCVAACAVALVCVGSAVSRSAAPFDGASLDVGIETVAGQTYALTGVRLIDPNAGDNAAPNIAARVDLTMAPGFQLDLTAKPGSRIGNFLAVSTTGKGSGADLLVASILVADPAAYAADPVAQACAPGTHAAVWTASGELLRGGTMEVPIAVDQIDVGGAPAYVLHYCPSAPPSAASPDGVVLVFSDLAITLAGAPSAPGTSLWSAAVTPATPGSFAPDATGTFELRALVPTPNTLVAHGRYDAKAHTAVVTGTVTSAGAPRAGAAVYVARDDELHPAPVATTDAAGRFTVRRRIGKTTTYDVYIGNSYGPCADPSSAPGGCKGQTISTPEPVSVAAVVPRSTDPKVAIRGHDQALATRSLLTLADFPGGSVEQSEATAIPCAGFAPQLHALTVTGQASSPFYDAAGGREGAFTNASVFRDIASAKTAFAKEAQAAALRCEATDYAGSDGRVASLVRVTLPKAGNDIRAYRARVVLSDIGNVTLDLVFIRVGRVVVALHVYSVGGADSALDIRLSHLVAQRAR